LLQYVDASLSKFLDPRAAFRFEVSQLVVLEVQWLVSAVVVQLRRTLLLHHSYTILPM